MKNFNEKKAREKLEEIFYENKIYQIGIAPFDRWVPRDEKIEYELNKLKTLHETTNMLTNYFPGINLLSPNIRHCQGQD